MVVLEATLFKGHVKIGAIVVLLIERHDVQNVTVTFAPQIYRILSRFDDGITDDRFLMGQNIKQVVFK